MATESIDLIYLDPPFNSKHDYSAPIGSKAAGVEFKDTWTLSDIDVAWWGEIADSNIPLYTILDASGHIGGNSVKSYLIYMAIRIIEMYRILKTTGSLYLHCDPTMSHYLKIVLDCVFEKDGFRNEIIWERNGSRAKIKHQSGVTKSWGTQNDTIFFYGKKNASMKQIFIPDKDKKFPYKDANGREFSLMPATLSSGMGDRPNQEYEYKDYTPKYGWRYILSTLEKLDSKGYIYWNSKGTPHKKLYKDEYQGKPLSNIWTDIDAVRGAERTGYPTQKPLVLLERIIEASSDVGDVVFDPFCGCATACLGAEKLGRNWIGCDISERAYSLIAERLKADTSIAKFITGSGKVILRTDIPTRTGYRSKDIKHKLYGKQEGFCNGCKHHYNFKDFEVDHIVASGIGGFNDDSNLQLLCGNCNRKKGTRTMEELRISLIKDGVTLK